jgi:lipopolysaccharide export system permease protein
MPLIERYIFRRAMQAFLLTLGALVAALWVTEVLRRLDVVTAKGQAISVFLLMTVFGLPALVQVVAPIAYLVATIVTLNSLANDGELPVIPAAGASPKAINRPIILLGVIIMLAVALSHHVLAPASLANFRVLLTRVRADVIATLVQAGGFRAVDNGLTMHFRSKEPDGSFRDIFVNDERDPKEAVSFAAARGVLLQHAGGTFIVLEDGDLIRSDRVDGDSNVVSFETYALDLSQLGTPNAAPVYQAMERSTLFLLEAGSGDPYTQKFPQRVRAELHERTTAPLFTLAFGLIALAFLAQPHSNRQGRGAAIAAVVALCLGLRAAGFASTAVGRNLGAAIPFMYAVPLTGILFGVFATMSGRRLRAPSIFGAGWDAFARLGRRAAGRNLTLASVVDGDSP